MDMNLSTFTGFARKLYRNRSMMISMAVRELRVRYVGSFFGFFWAVINPLFQLGIYGIVFGVFFKATPDPAYGTNSYFLYLLCGIIPWQFFSESIIRSAGVLIHNGSLVKGAVGFPSEILPIVAVWANLINHFVGIAIVAIVLLVFSMKFSLVSGVIFIYLFFISIFAVGLAWIVSSINVYVRDVSQVIGVVLLGVFFLTPVLYSPNIVPPRFLVVLKLNPLFHMVTGYRLALLTGKLIPGQDFIYLVSVSFLTFVLGGIVFRKLKRGFAEVL